MLVVMRQHGIPCEGFFSCDYPMSVATYTRFGEEEENSDIQKIFIISSKNIFICFALKCLRLKKVKKGFKKRLKLTWSFWEKKSKEKIYVSLDC